MYIPRPLEKRIIFSSGNSSNVSVGTTAIVTICIFLGIFVILTALLCLTKSRRRSQQRLARFQKPATIRVVQTQSHRMGRWQRLNPEPVSPPTPAYVVGKDTGFGAPPAYQA